jgi:hypothetical protein
MQGAEVRQLLGLKVELGTGSVQRFSDSLGGERYEGYTGRVYAPRKRFSDDLDQGMGLTATGRPEDQAAIRDGVHAFSPVSTVEHLLLTILRPPVSGPRFPA